MTPILEDALMDRDLVHRPGMARGWEGSGFFQEVSVIDVRLIYVEL